MKRLIYKSTAAQPISWNLISDLLRHANERNKRHGLTGLLAVIHDQFVQVLEGPADAINALYANIIRDARHRDVMLLGYEDIQHRTFGRWSMAGVDVDKLQSDEYARLLQTYTSADGRLLIPDDPQQALALCTDLLHLEHLPA